MNTNSAVFVFFVSEHQDITLHIAGVKFAFLFKLSLQHSYSISISGFALFFCKFSHFLNICVIKIFNFASFIYINLNLT